MLKFKPKEEWPETFIIRHTYEREVVIEGIEDEVGELTLLGDAYFFMPYDGYFFSMNDLTQINDRLYRLNNDKPAEDVDWP